MHYCVHLITKDFPTKTEIAEIMEPYNFDRCEGNPIFTWDWYEIGGRYGGCLKLKFDHEAEDEYRWKFYSDKSREGRLFYSTILKQIRENFPICERCEEDYVSYMGARDGFLYVDGAKIKDILNFEDIKCFICIDVDKNVIARSSWNGKNFVEDTSFDEKYKAIKERSKDYFITVIDIHD